MKHVCSLLVTILAIAACSGPSQEISEAPMNDMTLTLQQYHETRNPNEIQDGNIELIPIQTPVGEFKVWTKRVGNNPDIKLLFLHGGPGFSHDYFECADSFLPQEGIEYYYYDQLGSAYSDQPTDTSLWNIDRFVEEVEQVRKALGLGPDNFYILGHSWGGILAIEYALKYQQNIKGLIISNMMSSVPEYNAYAQEVLGPMLPPDVLEEIQGYEAAGDYENQRYLDLIMEHYYPEHVLRMPMEDYPDPMNRAFEKFNPQIYVTMQGPSEFG
ncbi:MAG: proline iminopeptidase-family hydrolase, partial [Cyclobacteriaceae bacterium]